MTVSELYAILAKHGDPDTEVQICYKTPDGGVEYVPIVEVTGDQPDDGKTILAINVNIT